MLQLLLYALLAIIVAGALFLLATRFLPAGEQIAPPLRDEAPWELPPERRLAAEDVDGVRLPVALRGYRFAETDILLDRLAGELRDRDVEIARLRDVGRDRERDSGLASGGHSAPAARHDTGPVAADVAPRQPAPPPSDDDEQPVTGPPEHDAGA